MRWSAVEKAGAVAAALLWLALGGYFAAKWVSPDAEAQDGTVVRTVDGVAQTGVVDTVTTGGEVRRVIRWKTRDGTFTEAVTGPMQLRTLQGEPIFLTGPASTTVRAVTMPGATQTVRGTGSTVTLPGETVTETATETVHDTVTETVQNTVTEVVTVTETSTGTAP